VERPLLKPFLRVHRRAGEPHLYIGVGPDKVRLADPDEQAVRFISELEGEQTVAALRAAYPKADEWIAALEAAGVLDDAAGPPRIAAAEAERWSRQINYLRLYDRPGWNGFTGQRRISEAHVVVVGTGAGGTTLLRLLNAAGVGKLTAVDFDTFALDNLPTHATLDERDVGSAKVEAVARHLREQNSRTEYAGLDQAISGPDDLVELVDGADFFVQAYDRPRALAARWSNEASLRTGVPLTSIGATDKGARVGPTVIPGQTPCWECVGIDGGDILRPEHTAALTGATVAMLAGIAVNEMLAVLSGARPARTAGRSLYIDTDALTFTFTEYSVKAGCVCAGYRPGAAVAMGGRGQPTQPLEAR
jgi:molybdopterin/thiamine biosynthesis adenylyltransferase